MQPDTPSPDQLRDIQGFQAIVIPTWLWIVLAVIVVSLIVWLLYKYVFKAKPKPALSILEKTILLLQKLDLNEESKVFYLNYSEIVRHYLEERLKISLLDKTAEEIKPILMAETRINTGNAMALLQIFTRADLAKFARHEIAKTTKEADIVSTIQILTAIEEFVKFEEQKLATEVTVEELRK